MKIGYARTSTIEQAAGCDAQIRNLKGDGVEKLFKEQVSSIGERNQGCSTLITCIGILEVC